MKKILAIVIITILVIITIQTANYKSNDTFSSDNPLVLFDYNDKKPMNSISGQSGVFDSDPDNAEAYCRIDYSKDESLHKNGYHMKLSYDVDSAKPAFTGWWTKLNGINLSKFKAVSITIKGDAKKGFSDFFKVELKDKTRKIECLVEGISDKWTQLVIPFGEFEGDLESMDWNHMSEFVIVFEDWRLKQKEGRYLIDDISFIPKKGEKISFGDIIKK